LKVSDTSKFEIQKATQLSDTGIPILRSELISGFR
jgi:hypothetical protein